MVYADRPNFTWMKILRLSVPATRKAIDCATTLPLTVPVGFRWPKTTILGKFWHLGNSCTNPLLPMRAKFGVRPDWYILSPSGSEKPQILPFYWLCHFVVSPVGGDLRTLNTGAQLQTFPYPTVSKSFLYSNTFMAKSCAQLWRSKAWRTNRQ